MVTSGCTYVFAFWGGTPPFVDRWVCGPPVGLGVKGAGSTAARGGDPAHISERGGVGGREGGAHQDTMGSRRTPPPPSHDRSQGLEKAVCARRGGVYASLP